MTVERLHYLFYIFLLSTPLFLAVLYVATPINSENKNIELIPVDDLLKSIDNSTSHTEIFTTNITVKPGNTLLGIFINAGLSQNNAIHIIKQVKKYIKPQLITAGQKIIITAYKQGNDLIPTAITIYENKFKALEIVREHSGKYTVAKKPIEFQKRIFKASGEIETNFFNDFNHYDIPNSIVTALVKLYGYEFDFQREIKHGTQFQIIFEKYYDHYGDFISAGDILFTSINTGTKSLSLYRYTTHSGITDYFDINGSSVQRALLKTPIDGARISSRFGKRKHPISGYSKMHKGIDFAAPIGTRIYAAGSGTIKEITTKGGYGKYIKIKHDNYYSTAYAHLSKFNNSLKVGSKVRQGDVIGFVGKTGTATGPHLHYEVIYKGSQIDPMTLKSKSKIHLTSEELKEFTQFIKKFSP